MHSEAIIERYLRAQSCLPETESSLPAREFSKVDFLLDGVLIDTTQRVTLLLLICGTTALLLYPLLHWLRTTLRELLPTSCSTGTIQSSLLPLLILPGGDSTTKWLFVVGVFGACVVAALLTGGAATPAAVGAAAAAVAPAAIAGAAAAVAPIAAPAAAAAVVAVPAIAPAAAAAIGVAAAPAAAALLPAAAPAISAVAALATASSFTAVLSSASIPAVTALAAASSSSSALIPTVTALSAASSSTAATSCVLAPAAGAAAGALSAASSSAAAGSALTVIVAPALPAVPAAPALIAIGASSIGAGVMISNIRDNLRIDPELIARTANLLPEAIEYTAPIDHNFTQAVWSNYHNFHADLMNFVGARRLDSMFRLTHQADDLNDYFTFYMQFRLRGYVDTWVDPPARFPSVHFRPHFLDMDYPLGYDFRYITDPSLQFLENVVPNTISVRNPRLIPDAVWDVLSRRPPTHHPVNTYTPPPGSMHDALYRFAQNSRSADGHHYDPRNQPEPRPRTEEVVNTVNGPNARAESGPADDLSDCESVADFLESYRANPMRISPH